MRHAVGQTKGVSHLGNDRKACASASALLVGHADTAAVGWVGVAIAWVEQVEDFFGEVQPTRFVKIPCVVFADFLLELALPIGNDFMIRLCCGWKVIWLIDALLVEVDMHVR